MRVKNVVDKIQPMRVGDTNVLDKTQPMRVGDTNVLDKIHNAGKFWLVIGKSASKSES